MAQLARYTAEKLAAAKASSDPVVPAHGCSEGGTLLRLAIVSHAYIEEELRKGIGALAERMKLAVVTPDIADCLVFPALRVKDSAAFIDCYRPIRSKYLFGAQYMFLSPDLGFRANVPDVVCVQYDPWSLMFWQTLVYCRLFAPEAKIVCSVKKNTYRRTWGVGSIKHLITRAAMRHISRFMAASHMTAEMYSRNFGIDPAKIEVITPIGVDTQHFSPSEPRPLDPRRAMVGFAGRLEPHKGVEDLVEAVSRCRSATGLDIRLEVCGRGSLAPWLEDMALSCDWLTVRGLMPNRDVPAFLRSLDVFALPARVLPDHEEHDAHALLEALACGLPCIATRSGINTELLSDGSGILVEPQQPLELAAALGDLIRDLDRRRELASRARMRAVTDFDNHRLAERKTEFFEKVLRD
jgi:glycosyltransferase involved in cell wall biosynthesis